MTDPPPVTPIEWENRRRGRYGLPPATSLAEVQGPDRLTKYTPPGKVTGGRFERIKKGQTFRLVKACIEANPNFTNESIARTVGCSADSIRSFKRMMRRKIDLRTHTTNGKPRKNRFCGL